MGNFAPIFLAFVLNCADIFMFRTPSNFECFPYTSYVMFTAAMFCLLWDIPVNPFGECFRKLFSWVNFILEFLIAKIILETAVTDFWLPLQIYLITFLPKLSDYVANTMKSISLDCSGVCELSKFLKWHGTLLLANFGLSTFFLLCLAHATRVVDFRLLRCGGDVFINDLKRRGKKFFMSFFRPRKCLRIASPRPSCPRLQTNVCNQSTFEDEWKPQMFGSESDLGNGRNHTNRLALSPYHSERPDRYWKKHTTYHGNLQNSEPYCCKPYDFRRNPAKTVHFERNPRDDWEAPESVASSTSQDCDDCCNCDCCCYNY